MTDFPPGVFSSFANALVTVTRSTGTHSATGYSETGTTTILTSRADVQERTRTLDRLQGRYDRTLTAMVYLVDGLGGVQTGDEVTCEMDDGRTVTGSVIETRPMDGAVLI